MSSVVCNALYLLETMGRFALKFSHFDLIRGFGACLGNLVSFYVFRLVCMFMFITYLCFI